jgi:hypothetical protein
VKEIKAEVGILLTGDQIACEAQEGDGAVVTDVWPAEAENATNGPAR